ncbi:GMC family oxidoreductase [Histidinibacterium aquaticum]|uniref:GMC family oxidoreductase n=1 Tax=Histidinibacterium aquaticum TaxID=2613962 RepID=A0A5J5GKK5_9RHOB|nr:GMC family oxidoreductase [Histidinibacterium aquaticum]KAA9008856.1 GMC family oxidoreductase [Histidinibacterium aquaticum]
MAIQNFPFEPDVVVVGAGVAGGMAADIAASNGLKVVILESGPRLNRDDITRRWRETPLTNFMAPYPQPEYAPVPDPANWDNYLIQTGPDAYNQQYIRGVGGTTWHWAAATWRFLPSDFRLQSLYGVGRDWPLSYEDLEPWYDNAETRMGVAGRMAPGIAPRNSPFPMEALPLSYMDATIAGHLNQNGYQMVDEPVARNSRIYDGRPPCCGNNNCMPICPIAAQYSGNMAVERAEESGAIVVTEAVVHHLEASEDGRIGAVRYLSPDGQETRIAARAVVLAANGLETPRLMLMSRQERAPNGIGNSTGQVGRYLMDHPGTSVVFDMPEPVWPGRGPQEMTSILKFRDGEFRSRFAAKKLHLWNGSMVSSIAEEAIDEGLRGEELRRTIANRAARRCAINSFHELLPEPTNRLTLAEDRLDPLGLPRPQIHYEIGAYVRESALHTAEVYRDIVDTLGAELISVSTGEEGFAPNNHIMGGTIMGDDPANSVVNKDCRVHAYDNLWVASSSVFPSAACVNSTLTIAALALRVGADVALQLRN